MLGILSRETRKEHRKKHSVHCTCQGTCQHTKVRRLREDDLRRGVRNSPQVLKYSLTKEKIYDSFVPELRAGRLRARKLVKKYNEYLPDDATDESLAEDRYVILKQLIGRIGKGVDIDPPFRVDYGCNISIGDGFYGNFGMVILDCALVSIGDRTKFGPGVSIYAATHPTDVQLRREGTDYSEEVSIGNDCWIGGNTVILPGVTIGDGVTVGASSVVTKDIPSYSIAVGSPARAMKTVQAVPDLP
ncbi:Nodulation protein L [Lachnellula suecica]|uniref:Nodulation protein L n=1 Tax=Lachnellula suecica TaxID=602035 RepID=A0A8T9CIL7_9HELO|nr:Nodulation protein L [Lachnellula suecica]